jgi:cytochrome c-type biogenesis protein CcmF
MFQPLSREGSLVLNNVLLVTATATVLVGTLYPMALEAVTGEKISVGPPYFNMTFGPLMVPLLLAMPFGPLLAWKRGDLLAVSQRLLAAAVAALAVMIGVYAWGVRGPTFAPVGIAIGVFVMMGAIAELVWRTKFGEAPLDDVWRRARGLPRSSYGTTLGHFGIGLMVVGIVATSAYQTEHVLVMKPGEKVSAGGYEAVFKGVTTRNGPNYREEVADFDVTRDGKPVTLLQPSKRVYDMPPQPTTEAGILASWRGDFYLVIGDSQADGGYAVRTYFNPLVRFIWIGAVIMFLGGAVSLSDRRLRVGAPVKRRKHAPVPAE